MQSRVVDVVVDGQVIRSEEVFWTGLPGAEPMSDEACIASALEELWYGRFEPPPNATFRVRDP